MNTELDALDLAWGCAEIARVIRKTPKATYHLLSRGRLPARKEGGEWVARRSELERHFTASQTSAAAQPPRTELPHRLS